jgi:hypothetical protein
MPLMLGKLHDALVSAGADADSAREAAEEVAEYEDKFTQFEIRIERVEGKLALLQWMLGFDLAITAAILLKLFLH